MKCFYGVVKGLGSQNNHIEGHRVGAVVKLQHYMLWFHWAIDSSKLSALAGLNLDEAFAEGFVNGDPLLLKSVSRYRNADPATVGAPDFISKFVFG